YFLGENVERSRMNPLTEKLILPLTKDQFHNREAPLKMVCVLAPPAERSNNHRVNIKQFSSTTAFVELCRATFNNQMTKTARLREQFRFASDVASRVPVNVLSYNDGLDSLSTVRHAILSHLSGHTI